jgi:hypothetical protein
LTIGNELAYTLIRLELRHWRSWFLWRQWGIFQQRQPGPDPYDSPKPEYEDIIAG